MSYLYIHLPVIARQFYRKTMKKNALTSKCQSVYDYVKGLINSGKHALGKRLPTDGQLMRKFSVSRGTVIKAMRDLEHEGLILRRAGDGTYIKATAVNSAFVSIVIAGLGDTQFFEPICARIAKACQNNKLSLILGTLDLTDPKEYRNEIDQFCVHLKEQSVSGLFFAPDESKSFSLLNGNQYFLDQLSRLGIQTVLLDRSDRPFPESCKHDLVGIDNFYVGYLQTRHLLDCGCKRIFYVARSAFLSTKEARIAGYRYAMKKAGHRVPDDWIFEGDVNNGGLAARILDGNPEGIACFHDPIAITLIHEFCSAGIGVPQQVKIVGVDDVHYSPFLPIPLTTIHQPCQEIANTAVALMLDRLVYNKLPPRDVRLSAELIVRQSTIDKITV